MDSFTSNPHEFFIVFNSADKAVEKEENGYRFMLKTPLEFSTEWGIGIEQILLKQPFTGKSVLWYTIDTTPDGRGGTAKFTEIDKPSSPITKAQLVDYFNSKIPNFQKELYLTIDDKNIAVTNLVSRSFRIESEYFEQVLAIPSKVYTGEGKAVLKGSREVKIFSPHPVFHILVDIITPISYGSKLLPLIMTDIFPKEAGYKNYKYHSASYHKIQKSYISSLLISITDLDFNFFEIKDPTLIKFHFRKL